MELDTARELMDEFGERTGLTSDREPTRYLWTDAFAVCNYVGLARELDDERFLERATELVAQVHRVLGQHREDDARSGWLSGLQGADAEAHPTAGGLRIGKPRSERSRDEAYDARAEWDRDGQYFHYLTKWMHALDVIARETREPRYHRWSRELADVAHEAFVHQSSRSGGLAIYWKMSIDLTRPQVPTMGHHDPLDGLVTTAQILDTQRTAWTGEGASPDLQDALGDFTSMVEARDFSTDDPLGLGGLLMDVARLAQLGPVARVDRQRLLGDLVESAAAGLERFESNAALERPPRSRLAFRELGLAIGLRGVEMCRDAIVSRLGRPEPVDAVHGYESMSRTVIHFWLDPGSRRESSWSSHRDINEVMLASALTPGGAVILR